MTTDWHERLACLADFTLRFRAGLLVVVHAAVFAGVYWLAYLVRFDGTPPPGMASLAARTFPAVLAIKLIVFVATGSYRGWWRYATFSDMTALAESATISSILIVLAGALPAGPSAVFPRSIVAFDWAGTVLVLGLMRGSTRLFRERYYPMIAAREVERVLLVGASEDNLALIHAVQSHPALGMKVVGLLDRDASAHGTLLGGIKVLGAPEEVPRHATRTRARKVLVSAAAGNGREMRTLVERCHAAALKVQVVPAIDALINGDLTVQPRDVDIHDLLAREPVCLDDRAVGRFIRGRTVVVTGAAGSIGSELCRQVLAFRPSRLVLLDHSENGLFFIERELAGRRGDAELLPRLASVKDAARVRALFAEFRPEVVFHAAAHKHVPMVESNPGEAVKNNVFGTRTLVDEAVRAGVEAFVMISTDKAVNPTSVMGACKRLAEMYVQALSAHVATRLVTVRFGNVLGSNGSVVPVFKEQIRRGGPVTVTHPDMTRFFMTIPEAAQLVLQAGSLGHGGEIFVLDMGEPVRVIDLARDLIRLSGFTEGREIDIVFTGLRPGEKLYEELYDPGEQRLPTPHPKIFMARHRPCDLAGLRDQLTSLAGLVEGPPSRVVDALRDLLPEFRSEDQSAAAPVDDHSHLACLVRN
ncbi:MAG: nucleoside-diphosphate sugar epimerase/dehydratase [Isosphaeraceae bacterium]